MKQIGFDKQMMVAAEKLLADIPKRIKHRDISTSASKALLPAKNEAKNKLRDISVGSGDGISKALFLVRTVRVVRSRMGYPPGASLRIKGPDVPVYDREWKAKGFAKLLSAGSYKVSKRKWRSNGKNTGSFKGFGNFIVESANKKQAEIRTVFRSALLNQMRKAKQRALARYGR